MDVTSNELASILQSGIELKDRKYFMTTYKNCFVGNEAVDFMIENGYCKTREVAVVTLQSVMDDTKLFEHVTRDHPFKDESLFYHFIERGHVLKNKSTGDSFNWKDYVAPTQFSNGGLNLQPVLKLPDFEGE